MSKKNKVKKATAKKAVTKKTATKKAKAKKNTSGSKRYHTHIMESESFKIFVQVLPKEWVVRDLSERDYGIDLLVEIFSEDKKGDFLSTGITFWAQLKSWDRNFPNSNGQLRLNKSFLSYAESFPNPFLVFYIDIVNRSMNYIWVQQYLHSKHSRVPNMKNASMKIDFPDENKLFICNCPYNYHNPCNCNSFELERIKKIAEVLHAERELTFMGAHANSIKNCVDIMNDKNSFHHNFYVKATTKGQLVQDYIEQLNIIKSYKILPEVLREQNVWYIQKGDIDSVISDIKKHNWSGLQHQQLMGLGTPYANFIASINCCFPDFWARERLTFFDSKGTLYKGGVRRNPF